MYRRLLRPILFRFQPESVHNFVLGTLRFIGRIPGGRSLLRLVYSRRHPSLEREVCGLRFRNPIGLAGGFDKDARAPRELAALGFGFVEVGTVTPRPQPGNPRPRIFRLPQDKALLNRTGFNNGGLQRTLAGLRHRGRHRVIIAANIGKNTLTPNEAAPADYLKLFRNLYEYVDFFVVNIGCTSVPGISELGRKELLGRVLDGLFDFRRGQNNYRPILLKISPDLDDARLDEIIGVLKNTPLDGIVAAGSTASREGLKTPERTLAKIGAGGISGAPLKERVLELVRRIDARTEGRYPIIAAGGVMTPDDAQQMLDAGASLVEVYTGLAYNGLSFPKKICRRLEAEAQRRAAAQKQAAADSAAETAAVAANPDRATDTPGAGTETADRAAGAPKNANAASDNPAGTSKNTTEAAAYAQTGNPAFGTAPGRTDAPGRDDAPSGASDTEEP